MSNRFGWRLVAGLLVIAALAGFGYYAYNLGVAQGVAEAGRIAAPSGSAPVVVMWRPLGFGFFPLFPLLFILFWFFLARGLFWRGAAWRGRGCGYDGRREWLEDWHRRAHAHDAS